MITGMTGLTIIREGTKKTGHNTFLSVHGGVRPKPGISRIHGKIHHGLWVFLLSKNAMSHKNPSTIVPMTSRNHSWPTG